ncbi:MAG: metallopeptidase TldD-related protein [Candidatus Sericytochromatia bacterium]
MPFATALAERLRALTATPTHRDLAIDQWRLVIDTGTSTELGLKENHMGGPYEAPNRVTGTRGEAYIVWKDGRISSGTVDRTTLENLDEDLALWRQAAYDDEFAPDVLGPQTVPDVPIYDAEVAELVTDRQEPLFELLERVRRDLPAYDADRVSGSVTVSSSRRHLITSRGLDHVSAGTSFGAYADADHRVYDTLSLRRRPTEDEVATMIRQVGETNRLLRKEATLTGGRQAILLTPFIAEAMLNKYVLGNLDGQRVLNGQSAFSMDQFAEHAEAFHPSFGLAVDPLKPLSPGAYELTREGVPASKLTLIDAGRLQTPLLDLKHAKKAGLAPTPFPRGGSSLRLSGPSAPFDEVVKGIERGLIIYQILGLHTQDGARGNFSLTVSQGLVVENGVILGHAKAIIAGNFFQSMREGFRLGTVVGKEMPGLLLQADVIPG